MRSILNACLKSEPSSISHQYNTTHYLIIWLETTYSIQFLIGISNFIFAIWRASQLLILGATLPSAGKNKHSIKKAGRFSVFSCLLMNFVNVVILCVVNKTTKRCFLWNTDVCQVTFYNKITIDLLVFVNSKVSVLYAAETTWKKRRDQRCRGSGSRVMARVLCQRGTKSPQWRDE